MTRTSERLGVVGGGQGRGESTGDRVTNLWFHKDVNIVLYATAGRILFRDHLAGTKQYERKKKKKSTKNLDRDKTRFVRRLPWHAFRPRILIVSRAVR